jgi:hypothetical protein
MKDLYGKAADVAQSWGKTADKEAAGEQKTLLSTSNAASSVEQWAVNKACSLQRVGQLREEGFRAGSRCIQGASRMLQL